MYESDRTAEAQLNRRDLLKKAGAIAAGGLGLGGFLWGRHAYAVDGLEQDLLEKTAPITTATAHGEMASIPARARKEIRLFFTGACLDVNDFASEVCSQLFAERLEACQSDVKRHQLMALKFEQHVATTEEITNRVEMIAGEIGSEMDRNWADCCRKIAEVWEVPLRTYQTQIDAERLATEVEPEIRQRIHQAIQRTTTAVTRPAFSDVPMKIGKSALLLLPLVPSASPQIVLPVFVGVALKHIMEPVIAWLQRPNPREVRNDVAKRLKLLGNRVGAEFEREVRLRIADLHTWREEALQKLARSKAEASVLWI